MKRLKRFVDWSSMDTKVIAGIINHLVDPIDFVRIQAVCKPWRATARHCGLRPQPPSLVCSTLEAPEYRCFSGIIGGLPGIFDIFLPDMADHCCIGSSDGFLITVNDLHGDIHVTNPLTGTRITLPPSESQPDMELLQLGREDEYYGYRYSKAILSPTLDVVVLLRAVEHHWVDQSGGRHPVDLVFARVGDDKWTALQGGDQNINNYASFSDLIFHNGLLHAVDLAGTLYAFDLYNNPSAPPLLCSSPGPLRDEDKRKGRYLVESPDGNDLFLLYREQPNIDDEIPRTTLFRVFKLKDAAEWEEVDSIGEIAMFVGTNRSLSISTTQAGFPHLKSDSIYFTDNCILSDEDPLAVGDTGIYRLDDKRIVFTGPDNSDGGSHFTTPIWFTASLLY